MTGTPRLGLPFIAVGQAQKEFTHNESLQVLDILVGGAVEEPPRAAPPTSPGLGACYIVATGATGSWAGKSQCVAAWTSGGWRFIAPTEGMNLYDRSSGNSIAYRSGAWEAGIVRGSSVAINGQQVVGPRTAPIASPSGGSVIDVQSRTAITAILVALRQHGLIDV